jgi:hypothetical protein
MAKNGLKIVLPSAVDDASGLKKMEHYTGIEFTRGTSNQGGTNGYHKLIGDADLIKEQRFLSLLKVCDVINAKPAAVLNQTNWRELEDGSTSAIDGTDGGDIMQCFPNGIYAILGGTNETYERFIISDMAFSYDGDTAVYIPPIALPTDKSVILDGKQRLIRNDAVNGSQGTGLADIAGYGTNYSGGYPTTATSRYNYEKAARAKNSSDKYAPYLPYYNKAAELMQALWFIEFRTKNLNGVMGHAISANVSPTASTWGKVTGVRITADNGNTYSYGTFGTDLYINGTANNIWKIVNNRYPLLKIFEGQLAASDGVELEKIKNSDGEYVQSMEDGVMTGIYTKKFSFSLQAATSASGDEQNLTIDVVLRQPIVRGAIVRYGNAWDWISGYEIINRVNEDGSTTGEVWRCPDYASLDTSTTQEVATDSKFEFESKYDKLGEWASYTVSLIRYCKTIWTKNGFSSIIGKDFGGGFGSYENSLLYLQAETKQGVKTRRGVRVGGDASGGNGVVRCAYCYYSPAYTSTYIGSAFVCLLDE